MPDDAARAAIRRHLEHGAPWDACDAFRDALAAHPDDPVLLFDGALAHARAGATREAHALIDRALDRDPPPPLRVELRALRGRLWKDRVHRARDPEAAEPFARLALAEYVAAYAIAHSPYPGINAATLSMLLGDRARARALAEQVLVDLDRGDAARDTWALATAGEAELLVGRPDVAHARYLAAAASAKGDAGAVASMRRQLRLLARVLPDASALLSSLRSPDVVAFAGHMIDAPERRVARFPGASIPAVDAAIRERVARWHAPIVFGSAACGADLLVIEAALDAGAEVNVVLPFDRGDFVRTSVAVGGDEWVVRFDRALARAHRVVDATDGRYLGDDALFAHAARLVEGLAVLRAAQLETAPTMLCVLDPGADLAPGGTLETFERWRRAIGTPEVIDLRALRAASTHSPAPAAAPLAPHAAAPGNARRTIRTLLFADIVGYGRLTDAAVPEVQQRFWDVIARELTATASPPRFANTWGDGLYVVFDAPRDGASFALRLADAMGAIRIALHTGPVYVGHDPVIGRENYFGASVTQTARIEPVTPPGTVYATEAHAASLAADGDDAYTLEYVGRLALAKGHGESRIYRVSTGS